MNSLVEKIGEGFNSLIGKKVFGLENFSTDNNVVLTEKEMLEQLKKKNGEAKPPYSTTW